MTLSLLPALNATLNGTCALLLLAGYASIRKQNVKSHGALMGMAFLTSVLFLASYLTYHAFHGSTRFTGTGWIRGLYLAILISHTVLAVVIVPLSIRTLWLAVGGRIPDHRRIARWTLPLWLYVSVTGVIVYWMLYWAPNLWACPACSEAVGSQGDPASKQLTQGFARSIYLMMSAPYLVFAGVTFLIVRSARRARK
ncbi:MAG: DUF420 domain-containing protein [Candidatus Omnitrophica bacterium]|nr:DUF420 domain-containing protein [Candidatus Omnitrophota bacterium]